MNVRPTKLPLIKRYRTDLLSQKLSRLSVRLYTDALLADDTSMRGNKWAQIYADRVGFVHVFLMRSKAGEGDSIGNVVKDIGIMNETHCDNVL